MPAARWAPLLLSGGIGLVLGVVATAGFFLLRNDSSSAPALANGPGLTPILPSVASGEPVPDTPKRDEPRRPTAPRLSLGQSQPGSPDNRGAAKRAATEPAPGVAEPLSEVVERAASARVANRLHEEALLLRQAREQLGRGELTEANSTLSKSRVLFRDSLLLQEREALTIELMFRQGHRSEASSLAKVFLSKYPHSPHTVQVRRALASQR